MVGHNTTAEEKKDKLNGRTQYKVLKRKRQTKWQDTIQDKGNNKITELRTILQRESQNS